VLLTDFLRTAVLLFSSAATLLAALAVVGAQAGGDVVALYVGLGWWALTGAVGLYLGRRLEPSAGMARLLASARTSLVLPELEPARVIVNRLWALALFAAVCGVIGLWLPQIPAIGSGYALVVALAWRKQESAVKAIEGRDGVRFYIERGSPLGATKLLRTPGLRKVEPDPEAARQATRV
jgi:hypothetical protein